MSEKRLLLNSRNTVPAQPKKAACFSMDAVPATKGRGSSGGSKVVNENYRNYSEVDRDAPPTQPSDKQ